MQPATTSIYLNSLKSIKILLVKYSQRLTREVSFPFVHAIMLPSRRVVPFHAEPLTICALDIAYVADSAKRAIVRKTLADSRHVAIVFNFFISVIYDPLGLEDAR